MGNFADRTVELLQIAIETNQDPNAFYLLPDIIATLKDIKKRLDEGTLDSTKANDIAAGLGRLVTDSYDFSESHLGTTLLEYTSELRRLKP